MPDTAAHTYLKTHKLEAPLLTFDVAAEEQALLGKARAAKSGRAAKTLVKEGALRVTVVALNRGARLGAHEVEGAVSIQVLRGAVEVSAQGRTQRAPKGGLIALEPRTPHAARALRESSLLVTVAMP